MPRYVSLILGVCFMLVSSSPLLSQAQNEVVLILNMENIEALPHRFRTTYDELKKKKTRPSEVGLRELRASGSGQFSQKSLDAILKRLNNPLSLYIVDLRQESHGFMNGMAVSWYAFKDWGNKDKNLKQIDNAENMLLHGSLNKEVAVQKVISKNGKGLLDKTASLKILVNKVSNEQQLILEKGINYKRIPVTDHLKPSAESVDDFVAFIRGLPANAWVHFHCAAGQGRTTTFLTLYDMMRNAKKVSLEDILARQWLLGGLQFEKKLNPSSWKYESALERLSFLKEFYQYCANNNDGFLTSWSAYKSLPGNKN